MCVCVFKNLTNFKMELKFKTITMACMTGVIEAQMVQERL